jgi:alpha-amylase
VHATCAVTFIVTNAFVDGFMLKGVALGGDATSLGAWNPGAAMPLTTVSPGAWSGSIVLEDGQQLQFRFVETGPNEDVWESFTPAGNRTLTVACPSGASKSPPQYTGQFDVRPPDAT